MTKDEIIKTLRDRAKYPAVTLPRDCEALRAAADLLAQPERQPLTDSQIWQLVNDCSFSGDLHADKFARAIELHHGIGDNHD